IPFLFIIYPGMLAQAGFPGFLHAVVSGVVFVLAFANFFGGRTVFRYHFVDMILWLIVAALAVMPGLGPTVTGAVALVGLHLVRRKLRPVPGGATQEISKTNRNDVGHREPD
ncbi:MAG: hypothetical protein JW836_01420, partial [Deltaproteobacteria bacterium]|nr:hypothetical protein [Deltaproteobacteria bacterium]